MNNYSTYKESNIEWVGEIPDQWEVKPLFSQFKERHIPNMGSREINVLSLSYGQIIRRDVESNFGLLPESFETYNVIEPSNIVLRLTDLQNDKRSLRCGYVKEKGIITSAYLTLQNIKKIDCHYMYYLLHYYDIRKVFYAMGGGVRQTIKYEDLKRLPILLPSFDEQINIASYLDYKTKHIDDLIAKKDMIINLLKEERMTIISEVVTRGLDPRAEMKDSGIDWLGKVPKHWDLSKIRFMFHVNSGNGFPNELQGRCDGEIPFFKVSDINSTGVTIRKSNNYVSLAEVQQYRWSIIPKESILLAKIGAALEKNHRKITEVDCVIDNNMMAISPVRTNGDIKYYYYFMCVIRMEWFSNPGAVPSVDMQRYKSLFFPEIDVEEQKAMIKYLDHNIALIDARIDMEVKTVGLLKEYRTALIMEVVTGKSDVRHEINA